MASTSASTALSLACVVCWSFLTRSSCLRVSSFSSSRVSNSLASWAKSSSSSGSSLTLTACTVTVTSASSSSAAPPASSLLNVADSPADRPASASSRPSSIVPLPIWYDRPVAWASSTSSPSSARGQVDRRVVAVLGRALGGLEAGEALAQVVQVLLDVLVGDLGVVDGDAERGEVGELELRPDFDLGRERELLAVVELRDLDVRLAEGEHVGLLHGLAVELGQRVVHRLGQHRAAADPHVDDARRNLARAEPGDARLLRHLFVSLVEARLELLEGNLDAQPDTGRAQLFDIGLHGGVTPETWMD